jgi:hypothetical protein
LTGVFEEGLEILDDNSFSVTNPAHRLTRAIYKEDQDQKFS